MQLATTHNTRRVPVFALELADSALFDKVLEQANKAPTSRFVSAARAALKEKQSNGYVLSERTQELYELLC